ncbi:hypothetical protein [Acidihalobacter ferrooxydans]|nr:hypothetical protein [Acidihalobacter ferrooxydans]
MRELINASGSILEPACVQAFVDQFDEVLCVQPPVDDTPALPN